MSKIETVNKERPAVYLDHAPDDGLLVCPPGHTHHHHARPHQVIQPHLGGGDLEVSNFLQEQASAECAQKRL